MHKHLIQPLSFGHPQEKRPVPARSAPSHAELGYVDDSVVAALLLRLGRLGLGSKQGVVGSPASDEDDYAGWSAIRHREPLHTGRL